MTKYHRILVELFAPPLLGTIIIAMIDPTTDTFSHKLLGLPIILIFACIFGILPSAVYTLIMELWFEKGYFRKFGMIITVALSAIVGFGAAFGVELFSNPLSHFGWTYLLPVGFAVGIIIGLYVSFKQR